MSKTLFGFPIVGADIPDLKIEFGVYSPETGSPRKALPPEVREGWHGILIADDLDYAAHVKYDGGNEFRFTEVPSGKRLTGILVTSNGRFIWERRFKTPVYSAGGSVTVSMETLTDYFLC